MKKSKYGKVRYLGLRFNYTLPNRKTVFMYKKREVDEFLETEFPVNDNPLSAKNDTPIFNIYWNYDSIDFGGETVKTVPELKAFLEKCRTADGNFEIPVIKEEEMDKA